MNTIHTRHMGSPPPKKIAYIPPIVLVINLNYVLITFNKLTFLDHGGLNLFQKCSNLYQILKNVPKPKYKLTS